MRPYALVGNPVDIPILAGQRGDVFRIDAGRGVPKTQVVVCSAHHVVIAVGIDELGVIVDVRGNRLAKAARPGIAILDAPKPPRVPRYCR